jgi:3-hydroxyisobutyrate dehydrogenase-like beta-hydroxyacid dehydrogenase
MSTRIGFIGAGLMGHGVAKNILEKGYPLTVLGHRNREPVDDLVGRGAGEARSAAEIAAGAEVVFTCLPDSDVVERVVLGPGGILEGAREGLILCDLTTAAPARTIALGTRLAERGVHLLDTPMTLTPKEAEEGRLNLLVGGERALFDRLHPIFATFNERIWHIGPLGSAHTLKLINNFLSQAGNALVVEAITTALAAGVDPHRMREVISVSGGNSVSFQRLSRFAVGEDPAGGGAFSIRNGLKDVRYFTDLQEAHGMLPTMGEATRQFMRLAVALGYGDRMLPALFEVQDKLRAR